jgi:uncharacterized protein YabE (DUF348 family)
MFTTTPQGDATSSQESEVTGPVPTVRPDPDRPVDHGPSKALWWIVAAGLLVVVVGAAAIAYAVGQLTVEVSIDGETRVVETRADSVGDLLAEMEVVVTDADLVTPALDAELVEGETITVRYARPVTVVIDGSETEHVTTMLTVGDALEELGAPVDGAAISVPLSGSLPRTGLMIDLITPKSLSLQVGGEVREITTTGRTVGDLLEGEEIELAATDLVAPSIDTLVTEAMTVTVTRIRVENEERVEPIPHEMVEQTDPELVVGTRQVVTEGVDGSRTVTYAVTYTNGEFTSEEEVSSTVTKEPVNEVVVVGTKPLPASDLNWAALAQCESSGNPRAVNPAGYYGLYQFSLPTWASVGGSGNPIDATPEEQTLRAQILYQRSGPGQWPHCGPRLFG